jgi:hypothetical protein
VSVCSYELFCKNTSLSFSCRNPEALKSQEEKVGECTHIHFILSVDILEVVLWEVR